MTSWCYWTQQLCSQPLCILVVWENTGCVVIVYAKLTEVQPKLFYLIQSAPSVLSSVWIPCQSIPLGALKGPHWQVFCLGSMLKLGVRAMKGKCPFIYSIFLYQNRDLCLLMSGDQYSHNCSPSTWKQLFTFLPAFLQFLLSLLINHPSLNHFCVFSLDTMDTFPSTFSLKWEYGKRREEQKNSQNKISDQFHSSPSWPRENRNALPIFFMR